MGIAATFNNNIAQARGKFYYITNNIKRIAKQVLNDLDEACVVFTGLRPQFTELVYNINN